MLPLSRRITVSKYFVCTARGTASVMYSVSPSTTATRYGKPVSKELYYFPSSFSYSSVDVKSRLGLTTFAWSRSQFENWKVKIWLGASLVNCYILKKADISMKSKFFAWLHLAGIPQYLIKNWQLYNPSVSCIYQCKEQIIILRATLSI